MCNMENRTLDTRGYVQGGEEVETRGPHRRQPPRCIARQSCNSGVSTKQWKHMPLCGHPTCTQCLQSKLSRGRSITRCATNSVPRLSPPPPRPQRLKRLRRRCSRWAHTRHTPSPPWSQHSFVLSKLLKSQAAAGAEPPIHQFP